MNSHFRKVRFVRCHAARGVVTALLALALLSAAAPFGVLSASHLCALACCAGLPAHEAGSCMHGSCHARLSPRGRSKKLSEPICGAPYAAAPRHHSVRDARALKVTADPAHDLRLKIKATGQASSNSSQETTGVEAGVFTKPCPPDCGAGAFNSTSQSRPRDSALVSHAARPRPPSNIPSRSVELGLVRTQRALCRKCAPRAPPASFS